MVYLLLDWFHTESPVSLFQLEVFRPFFIRLDLPYSVKRGEKLALPVVAFNYLETDQKVAF